MTAATEPSPDGEAPDSPAPDTDQPAEPAEPAEKPPPPAVTRLVLARHAVTAQTGPLLTGRAPGVDLSDEGRRQADALAERLAGAPGRGGLRQPDRAHDPDRRGGRGPPRARGQGAARRDRGRLRRVDGREDRRPRQDRPVEDGAAGPVAGPVPRRRVAGRDADPHGRRARGASSPTTRASSSSWSRTPTRSRPRSRTTPVCTSTCSSASSCRPRR